MVDVTIVCPPVCVAEQFPDGLEWEVLAAELRQAFRGEARLGAPLVNPRRMALRLIADGYSPEAVRWLIREGRVAACVEAIQPNPRAGHISSSTRRI